MAKFSQSFTSRQRSPKIAAAWVRDSQRKSASWLVVAAKKKKDLLCKLRNAIANKFIQMLPSSSVHWTSKYQSSALGEINLSDTTRGFVTK